MHAIRIAAGQKPEIGFHSFQMGLDALTQNAARHTVRRHSGSAPRAGFAAAETALGGTRTGAIGSRFS
jgi:hypothetical protein